MSQAASWAPWIRQLLGRRLPIIRTLLFEVIWMLFFMAQLNSSFLEAINTFGKSYIWGVPRLFWAVNDTVADSNEIESFPLVDAKNFISAVSGQASILFLLETTRYAKSGTPCFSTWIWQSLCLPTSTNGVWMQIDFWASPSATTACQDWTCRWVSLLLKAIALNKD